LTSQKWLSPFPKNQTFFLALTVSRGTMHINGETKCTKIIFHCQIIGGLIMKSYTPSHHYFSIWYFLFLRGIKNRFFLTYKRHFIVPLWERIFHYDGLISHIIINIENNLTWETLLISVCPEWTSTSRNNLQLFKSWRNLLEPMIS